MRSIQPKAFMVGITLLTGAFAFVVFRDDVEGRAPAPRRHVLLGAIKLKGDPPNLDALNKQFAELMKRKDTEYCLKCNDTEKTQQAYRLGGRENKYVGNVFVWITPDAGSFFTISDKQLETARKREVVLRQPHCAFIPHCMFLFSHFHPDQVNPRQTQPTGQVYKILNDAEIAHNVNYSGRAKNPGGNHIFAPGKDRVVDGLVPEMTAIAIRCNIHPWMSAYLWVVDTPYYAISHSDTLDGKDKATKDEARFGTYEIKDPPTGKVRIRAWHEGAGWLNKDRTNGEVIELKAGETTRKDFELVVPKADR
jgi:hypothetical protein